jgi:hypothetical protein
MTDMSFLPETRKASKICGFAAVTLNTSLAAARNPLLIQRTLEATQRNCQQLKLPCYTSLK